MTMIQGRTSFKVGMLLIKNVLENNTV